MKPIRQRMDELLAWYKANGASVPEVIVVDCRPKTIHRFTKKVRNKNLYTYRGQLFAPTKAKSVKPEQVTIHDV